MKTAPDPVHQKASVPAGVHKITHTSGTTGEPKGVMLMDADAGCGRVSRECSWIER